MDFSSPNVWVTCALFFLLGLLIGMWMTSGGRRKWKGRYKSEAARREAIEDEHARHLRDTEQREKEWRERDSLRGAAVKTPPDERPL